MKLPDRGKFRWNYPALAFALPMSMMLALMFVIGDKALFVANGMPESRVTVMTLIKQSGCLVTIIGGKLVFGEKNIRYKLLCAAVVVAGIVVAVI